MIELLLLDEEELDELERSLIELLLLLLNDDDEELLELQILTILQFLTVSHLISFVTAVVVAPELTGIVGIVGKISVHTSS